MTVYNIYMFVDGSNKPYIGFTSNYKKRIQTHSKKYNIVDSSVIYQTKDLNHAYAMEEYFIAEYDSFFHGLNKTIDGKGVYGKLQSTTGFRFSEESKKSMSESAKKRYKEGRNGLSEYVMTEENRSAISKAQTGLVTLSKLTPKDIIEIKKLYIIKPLLNCDGVEYKNKNVRGVFCRIAAKKYDVSPTAILDILKEKTYKTKGVRSSAKLTFDDAQSIRISYIKFHNNERLQRVLKIRKKRPYDRIFSEVYGLRYNVCPLTIYKIIKGEICSNIKASINNKIKTPYGYKFFDGIIKNKYPKYLVVYFENGTDITCSVNHKFMNERGIFKYPQMFEKNERVMTDNGCVKITSIESHKSPIFLYDIINSGEKHCYFTNGVVSHNCAFVSNKGTLIQSEILESLRPREPISETLGIRLFNDIRGKRIGLSVDVGTGTGQDYSVIQLFDLDTFEQIGEFDNNMMNLTDFTKHIIKILEYIDKQGATEIFYTVEANSIGQGVIQLLHSSEIPILKKAEFISGTGKQLGIMTTTKSKMRGCTKFKDLVEGGGMNIHSKRLISELKFFVKSGTSFSAESGKNDDLVMGCVLFCLMVDEIGKYDADVYDKLNDSSIIGLVSDEEDDPLPFVF